MPLQCGPFMSTWPLCPCSGTLGGATSLLGPISSLGTAVEGTLGSLHRPWQWESGYAILSKCFQEKQVKNTQNKQMK